LQKKKPDTGSTLEKLSWGQMRCVEREEEKVRTTKSCTGVLVGCYYAVGCERSAPMDWAEHDRRLPGRHISSVSKPGAKIDMDFVWESRGQKKKGGKGRGAGSNGTARQGAYAEERVGISVRSPGEHVGNDLLGGSKEKSK